MLAPAARRSSGVALLAAVARCWLRWRVVGFGRLPKLRWRVVSFGRTSLRQFWAVSGGGVEGGELFDLGEDGVATGVELCGEAFSRPKEEVGAGFVPEAGSLVVEAEGEVAGEGGGEGQDEADAEPEVVGGEPGFGDPGHGKEEEGSEDFEGGGLVGFDAEDSRHDLPHQAVGGVVEKGPQGRQREVDEEAEEAAGGEAEDGGRGVGGSDLVVAQAGGVEEGVVGADGGGRGGDLLGVAGAEVLVACEEGAAEGVSLGEGAAGGQLGGAVAVEVGGAGDQPGVLPGVVIEGDELQGVVDAGGEGAGGGLVIGFGQRDLGGGVERLPHLHQGARTEGPLAVEEETDGHDAGAEPRELPFGLEDDAGGAGLQRLQGRIAVARPLREEGEGPSLRQQLVAAGEGLGVLRRVAPFVLPAVDGDGAGEVEEGADGGVLPQGALAEEARRRLDGGEGPDQQQGVDQPVDVVRYQHEGVTRREALGPRHLDLAEEDAEDQANQAAEEAVGGGHERFFPRAAPE